MTSLQLQLLVVTDQYCNIISRGNHKLLSSFILQKSKLRAAVHPAPGWSRFGWFVPGTVCTFLEGEETSHKGQQDTGFILGSQINMHVVVCLIDVCPLKAPCSDGEGWSPQSHWCAAWSMRRRAEQELSPMQNFNVTAHTRVNTSFPWGVPGIYGSPRGFAAVPAMLQEPHAVLSAVLDQHWHFLEHLCFSWSSLLSILTRLDVAYLQWLGQLISAGLEGMI